MEEVVFLPFGWVAATTGGNFVNFGIRSLLSGSFCNGRRGGEGRGAGFIDLNGYMKHESGRASELLN